MMRAWFITHDAVVSGFLVWWSVIDTWWKREVGKRLETLWILNIWTKMVPHVCGTWIEKRPKYKCRWKKCVPVRLNIWQWHEENNCCVGSAVGVWVHSSNTSLWGTWKCKKSKSYVHYWQRSKWNNFVRKLIYNKIILSECEISLSLYAFLQNESENLVAWLSFLVVYKYKYLNSSLNFMGFTICWKRGTCEKEENHFWSVFFTLFG